MLFFPDHQQDKDDDDDGRLDKEKSRYGEKK